MEITVLLSLGWLGIAAIDWRGGTPPEKLEDERVNALCNIKT